VRWLVLIFAVLLLVRVGRSQAWGREQDRLQAMFTGVVDLQMLLGVILYAFLSPATQEAFKDMAFAMRNGPLRFWAVEHLTGMIVAVALAHVGRALARKSTDPATKPRRALLFTSLSLVVMVLSIPWPGLPNGRPLFRFGS
jgi:hypothetical protein